MKIFCWNCQGIDNPHTRDYLRFCLTQYDPDIFFLFETKDQPSKMQLYLTHTKYPNFWFYPAVGCSGSIVLAWKNGIDL